MRSVRCEACGSKALVAASQCPKCGRLFEVRDGFGDLVPLAYCERCDSYYPESLGACRWCGAAPAREPIAPMVWRGVGVAALIALGFGAWLSRDREVSPPRDSTAGAQLVQQSSSPSSDSTLASVRDSAIAQASDTPLAPAGDSTATAPVPVADSAATIGTTSELPALTAPPRRTAESEGTVVPTPTSRTATPGRSTPSRRVRWVRSVARGWVVVRADPRRESRIVASLGPNTRVQLGETREGWIRLRTSGLSGWVERRAFFGGPATRRSRALGAR
jgi:hypothetical protein